MYYWAHMLDEAMQDKCMLAEDEEGNNINKAEKWLKQNQNAMMAIGQQINGQLINNVRDIITLIRKDVPASRLPLAVKDGRHVEIRLSNGDVIKKGTCRWMLGVCRIYFDELSLDSENA